MNINKQSLAKVLTYAGMLPFVCVAVIPIIQPEFLGLNYNKIILTYGAVIASFIAGIHWGIYLLKDININLFLHSNVVALLAWIAVVIALPASFIILIFSFTYLVFIDYKLANKDVIDAWYMQMRIRASIVVILTLVIHLLFR